MKHEIIYPMAIYFLFMFFSGIYMFLARKKSVMTGEVSTKYFKAQIGTPPPENILIIGRHYDNQFQVPMLFLITCVVHLQLEQANLLTLILAWLFVFSRFIHSIILLGKNNIIKRAAAFGVGWLILFFMWLQIIYFVTFTNIMKY